MLEPTFITHAADDFAAFQCSPAQPGRVFSLSHICEDVSMHAREA